MKKQIFITLALLLLPASLSFAREINPIRDTVLFLGYDKSVSTDLSTVSASSIGVQALQIVRGRQALASIAGMLPGVNVTSAGNLPDNGQAMFVRGRGSFSGNNVMYIVDGVERSPAFIGAEEVENITVLKDAAAIAIYGNRGSGRSDCHHDQEGTYSGHENQCRIQFRRPDSVCNASDGGRPYLCQCS